MVLPPLWGIKGLVTIALSFGTGTAVLVAQAVEPASTHFGELGGWLIGVLILTIGALLTIGIRDFQNKLKELDDKLDKLNADFREHCGQERAIDRLGDRLADRLADRLTDT